VYVPPSADPHFLRFVAGFVRHSSLKAWQKAMGSLATLNRLSLDSFDRLESGGVQAETRPAEPFLAAYRSEAERVHLLEEIQHIHAAGQAIDLEALTGDEARALEPHLSDQVGAAVLLKGQRFVDPRHYVHALAESVRARGGKILDRAHVFDLRDTGSAVVVTTEGSDEQFDAAVLATGAWLGKLARPFGVRRVVQAGRGYSFSIEIDQVPDAPVYFPTQRVACTPIGDRLRVAGMMEFRKPEAPLDQRRIHAIAEAVRPLLRGVDLDSRSDEWVGSRPCTVDGLPLIGASRSPRVYVAGGHGMWGITLGPVTGRLLAQTMMTGKRVEELQPFDPLRTN
jgi:D-amino-acid dehydrogenase